MSRPVPQGSIRLKGSYRDILDTYFTDSTLYDVEVGATYDDKLDEVIKKIAVPFNSFMNVRQVYYVAGEALDKYQEQYEAAKERGVKQAWLSANPNAADFIVAALAKYPKNYELKFALPSFRNLAPASISMGHGISLELQPISNTAAWIKVNARGYFDHIADSELVSEALGKVKIFVFLLEAASLHFPFNRSARAARAWVTTVADGEEATEDFSLPASFAVMMGQIRLNLAELINLAGGEVNSVADVLAGFTEFSARSTRIYALLATEEYARVATAIEWYVDSLMVENQTVAYLEVCIGLEALLGDEKNMSDMTKRLCDRFAFTLGRNRTERTELAAQYRAVLELRGKLVHSKQSRLKAEDFSKLAEGRGMLRNLIKHEITNMLA